MARPKTPTNILEARNSFKRNPQRRRPNEPKPDNPIAKEPPRTWSKNAKKAYRDIVRACVPGVLTDMDQAAVEIAAHALGELRESYDSDKGMNMKQAEKVFAWLGKFGMNPSDRAGVVMLKK